MGNSSLAAPYAAATLAARSSHGEEISSESRFRSPLDQCPAALQPAAAWRWSAWGAAAIFVVLVLVAKSATPAQPAKPAEPAEPAWPAPPPPACSSLLRANTGILAADDVTGSIVVQGPLPGCYPPILEYEEVIRSAIARAKVRPVMTDRETEALVAADGFELSDYELVFVDFLSDVELDDNEWRGIAGRSYHSVQPSDHEWIRRSACGAGGCGFQVGNALPYDKHAPLPPGGGAFDFIHDLMTHKMDLPNGSNRKRLVFFHCASGVDRAGTVSLSYKMAVQHMTLPQAVTSLHAAKDYLALPNTGFQTQLMLWCHSVYKTTSGACAIPPAESGWSVRAYPDDLSGQGLSTPPPFSTTTTTTTTVHTEGRPDFATWKYT